MTTSTASRTRGRSIGRATVAPRRHSGTVNDGGCVCGEAELGVTERTGRKYWTEDEPETLLDGAAA